MNNPIKFTLALGFVVAATVLTSTANAQVHSRSKDLVVMEGHDLTGAGADTRATHSFFTPTMQEARISMSSNSKALAYPSSMSRIQAASSWWRASRWRQRVLLISFVLSATTLNCVFP